MSKFKQAILCRRSFALGCAAAVLSTGRAQQTASTTRRIVPGTPPNAAAGNNLAAESGRRVALLIGNIAYQHVPVLKNAVNDASDLGERLKRVGFEVSVKTNASASTTQEAIRVFTSGIRPGDAALLFYSGHGVQSQGENFLIPVDFSPAGGEAAVRTGGVKASAAREGMEKAGAQVCVVILDACRDNPFRPGDPVRGMALMEPGLGACIALATGPGKISSDNPLERNGLFTKHLLLEVDRPGQDIDGMFKKVKDRVAEASGGAQRPWVFSDIVGQFYLAPPVGASPAGPNAPPSGAGPLLQLGEKEFRAGNFAGAAKDFEQALRIAPENPYTYNALGSANAQMGKWSVALGYFNQAIEKKPDYGSAYFNRGIAYYNAGNYELALQSFSWAVEEEPSDPRALDLRGKTHLALRDNENAIADFDSALTLDPSDSTAMTGLGSVYSRQSRLPDALRMLTASIGIRPSVDSYLQREQVYRQLRQPALADQDRREAERLRSIK